MIKISIIIKVDEKVILSYIDSHAEGGISPILSNFTARMFSLDNVPFPFEKKGSN